MTKVPTKYEQANFDSGAVILNSNLGIDLNPVETDILLSGTGFSTLTSNNFVATGGATSGRIQYTGASGQRCLITLSITTSLSGGEGSEFVCSLYRNAVKEIEYGYNYQAGRKNTSTYTYLTTVNNNDIWDARFQSIDNTGIRTFNGVVLTLQLLQS